MMISDDLLSPQSLPIHSAARKSPSIFALPLPTDRASPSYFPDPDAHLRGRQGSIGTDTARLQEEDSSKSTPHKSGRSRDGLVLQSLGKQEMEVVKRRYDLMSDEELSTTMREWQKPFIPEQSSINLPDNQDLPTASSQSTDSQSPLFPPSPTSVNPLFQVNAVSNQALSDHPLRIMAKAFMELQETVETLRRENAELRAEIERGRRVSGQDIRTRGRGNDTMSIHDDLNDAISTSLTTSIPVYLEPGRIPSPTPSSSSRRPAEIRPIQHKPAAYSVDIRSHHNPSNRSIRSVDLGRSDPLMPSNRSIKSIDSRNGEPIFSSNRSVRSVDPGNLGAGSPGLSPRPVRKRDAARASWTSTLWGWGGSGSTSKKGVGRDRKGSVSSSLRDEIRNADDKGSFMVEGDEVDEHAWRKGDGGSCPSFRAVFLATRLVTPDPSSILSIPQISPDSLIAQLAHTLVSQARDQGVVAKDPPNTRRRPSRESRSRAASIMGEVNDVAEPSDSAPREKSYSETLAATALYGRSLLSSYSGSTIRGSGKSKSSVSIGNGDDTIRPSLLNRTSARTFPTTALTPSVAADTSSSTGDGDDLPLPSVEMASIVAGENQPPTVLLSRQNLGLYFQSGGKVRAFETASRFKGADPPLTDRYGFIYDIQHASMLKDASAAGVPPPASLSGLIPGGDAGEGWIEKRRRGSHETRPDIGSRRSTGSIGHNTTSPSPGQSPRLTPADGSGTTTPSRTSGQTSDIRHHRSSTLINLNPSPARPITAKDTLTVSARGASSLRSVASPQSTPLSELPDQPIPPSSSSSDPRVSRATVSSLLDQLTELHDRQQAERKIEWDAWLNKRKRKRATTSASKGETGWGGDLIGISQMGLGDAEEWRAFAKLVRHGIPLAYRSDVWAECSGAKDALVPGEYREILAVHANDPSPVLAEIEKDVSRTFPGNMFFGGDGPGVAKLRRVLVAYSWRNPKVGYCQGMNMLAATLLLTHTDEEQAFWVLSAMIDRLLPNDFYSPSLLASRADQLVLADLVELHLPKISATLAELGVDLASITFGWFLSLFTDCLPVETLFRVWDVFFVEGHDTLFRVALAILKSNEAEICAADSAGDLFTFVSGMTARLWAADKLILAQHGYRALVRHSDIATRYAKHLAELQET